jgi:hypothetical protein
MSCEDIKHTLFTCNGANEVWIKMGLGNLGDEACALDRSGSVVMKNFIIGVSSGTVVCGSKGIGYHYDMVYMVDETLKDK